MPGAVGAANFFTLARVVTMNAPISNPADCEVRGVIRFLQAENVRPSEIRRRLVAVYGEHVMNAAGVRKWCTMFTNGRTDVHDAER